MKELLKKMRDLEQEMEKAEQQSEYWLQEGHFDIEQSNRFEAEADSIYENLYQLLDQAAEVIVSTTFGRVDKSTARAMIRERRSDIERLFA